VSALPKRIKPSTPAAAPVLVAADAKRTIPAPEGWPEDVSSDALHGIIGRLLRGYNGRTEADPHGILMQALIGFGNMIGHRAYIQIHDDRHYMNNFAVLVGESGRARKGARSASSRDYRAAKV
jgi:hypothetical protein